MLLIVCHTAFAHLETLVFGEFA
ncbi:hypothetical protein BN11_230024 [Nostocoides australiense Ben110]|uniref:Uncharacterized protein n=1 Tax=Nostocoides australiense Ben110 TaxID=1193182 RepID=W6JUJ7_9MICO|nr:hypothetical protein BN11_230024 [Tetrasphaera australiensis Ben110]